MMFKKKDIVSGLVIGEISALLIIFLSKILELPDVVHRVVLFFPLILPVLSVGGIVFVSLLKDRLVSLYQLGKNFLVGISNTLIDLSILNLLMMLSGVASGLFYVLFKALSFSSATVNSYFWNKAWTFEKEGGAEGKEFTKFYTVALGGLVIHLIVSALVVNVVGPQFGASEQVWGTVGGLVSALVAFLWDFFGYKFLVFKK